MIKSIVINFVTAILLAVPLLSQDTMPRGVITGRVVSLVTKEPLIGVNVVVVGTTIGAATNEFGRFRIENVPVGINPVRASIIGYQPEVMTDVVVSPARPIDIVFELSEMTVELEAITVTDRLFRKSPDKLLSVQTQSYEEIRRLPGGFEDVLRAISVLPGVAQVDAGRNDLIVRGGAPSENLYLVDDIALSNINHFGTQGSGGGPLSYINLDFVSGTTFSSGGFGARYGDKLSSVLTIDLREGRTDRFGGKATISATQFGLNVEGPLNENGSFLFSARRSYLDLIFKAAGFGFVPEYWDFLGKATYQLSSHDRLSVLGILALDNVRLFNKTEDQRFDNSRILASDHTQGVGGVSWQRLFASGYFTVVASQTFNNFEYLQNDSLLQPIFKNNSVEQEFSLHSDLVYILGDQTEFSAGVHGKWIRFDSDLTLRPFWTNFGQQLSVRARFDTTATKLAGYLQLAHRFGPLRIIAGGRLDSFSLIENSTAFAPRLSLSFALHPSTTFNGSVGRYYQAPSYIWLVANPANRQLRNISVDQYVVGIEHVLKGDTKLSVEVYQKGYRSYPASIVRPYLVLANTGAGFGGSEDGFSAFGLEPLLSAGKGWSRGAEMFLQKKFSETPYYGTIGVSFSRTAFTALDGVERPSSFDQRWILNIGGGYILQKHWEFSGKFRLATGRPYTPYNEDGTQEVARFHEARIPTNHSLDMRVDRRWMFQTWTLILYLDVQNIYNRQPRSIPRFNERTQRIEENRSIGILPTIGASAEF
jgi:hypothetical protein